jgi:PE-PPE domain
MRGMRQSTIVIVLLALAVWFTGLAGPIGARAVTALVMGGTGQPHPERVNGYLDTVGRLYLDPVSSCKVPACTLTPVYIPNEASPIFTGGMVFGDSVEVGVPLLDAAVRTLLAGPEQIVVFGYSQSATVLTEEIRALSTDPGVDLGRLEVVLIGDPNRPNGGFLQRFYPHTVPIFEYRPEALPLSQTPVTVTDISFQYDIAADFPKYPLNLFALLNIFIANPIHGTYPNTHAGHTEAELLAAINDPKNSQVVGNTTYITIPAKSLPLADALRCVGYTNNMSAVMTPLADFLEPTLRVLVELGYDRHNYGRQKSFGLIPVVDPVTVVHDLGSAIGEGIRNLQDGAGKAGPRVARATATGEVEPGQVEGSRPAAPETVPAAEAPAIAALGAGGAEGARHPNRRKDVGSKPAARDNERVVTRDIAAKRRPVSTYATHPRHLRDITRHSAASKGERGD